ncbi:MAG TPA: bifunctional adenosylcobinamide kinase/adenosylcobinamide-phosphate guanylyltransferase [Candidatus Binataceae bacterium]|nr:bifunctional adenosylcobinamide kinase/adenosylcobinamide-phosphate guanylyltransferase [Candidatus Binataceae bacterium]
MSKVTLITGGARSGKSAIALRLAAPYARKYFIATAQAGDDEMAARIAHHRAARPAEFHTIEEPIDIADAIAKLRDKADVIVLDCLTLWISNLMPIHTADEAILEQAQHLTDAAREMPPAIIVITDEVGAGVVPDNEMGRRFRDLLGWTNQKFAQAADEVTLMVAGIPVKVK